jgi:hypothetical protein
MLAIPGSSVRPADEVSTVSRMVRLPGFCLTSIGLGVGAHQVVHGSAASWPALALAISLVSMTWYTLSHRELRLGRLTLIVWLSQVEVHLSLLSNGDDAAHHMVAATPPTPWLSGWQMVLSHAMAGLLVAMWLRRGESLTWRLARRLVGLRLAPMTASVPHARLRRLPVTAVLAPLHHHLHCRALSMRGPPALSSI